MLSCLLLIGIFYTVNLQSSQNNLQGKLNEQTRVLDSVRSALANELALNKEQIRVANAANKRANQQLDSLKAIYSTHK